MCCVYWWTTTMTNSTIIRPHIIYVYWMMTTTTNPTIRQPHIVFTDGWQRQIQSYYDHMLCLLTGDKDKSNHNTTTYYVYWRTTTTINPTIIRPHIIFTDGRQKRQTQSWFDHILYLLIDDNYCNSVFFPEDKLH